MIRYAFMGVPLRHRGTRTRGEPFNLVGNGMLIAEFNSHVIDLPH